MRLAKHISAFETLRCVLFMAVMPTGFISTPAASSDGISLAKSSFDRAVAHFAHERYSEALALFEASYAEHPRATTLFNMAMCNKALMRNAEAIHLFETFLVSEGGDAAMRKDAAKSIDALLRLVGIVELVGALNGASVWLNETRVGTIPLDEPIVLNPGIYRIAVVMDGYVPMEDTVSITPGARNRIWAKLKPLSVDASLASRKHHQAPVIVPPRTEPTLKRDDDGDNKGIRNAGLVTGVAGLFAIGAGVAFSAMYLRHRNDGNLAAKQYGEIWDERFVDTYHEAKENMENDTIGMAVGFSVGGALVSSAAVMLLVHGLKRTRHTRTRVGTVVDGDVIGIVFRRSF